MKIAIGQIAVQPGKMKENFEKIRMMVSKALIEKADLVVFPALCLSGECMLDRWMEDDFVDEVLSYNEKVAALSQNIDILFGSVFRNHSLLFSAGYMCHQGQYVTADNGMTCAVKSEPSSFRGYQEENWFAFGGGQQSFTMEYDGRQWQIGVCISEDMVTRGDCDLQIVLANKPFLIDERKNFRGKLLFVNAAGGQNVGSNMFVMAGNSGYYADGKKLWGCDDDFSEQFVCEELETVKPVKDNPHRLLDAICTGVREFDAQVFNGGVKWIIGLSGGIDSSVSAAVLVRALGAERVVGYNLATTYNSARTKNNAAMLADKLGVELRNGSIEAVVQATLDTLDAYGYKAPYPTLAVENVQARVRGHMLMSFSSLENGVVVNNGNKIETALGYCTMYGDEIGALSPLADLTKVQVFELAKDINRVFGREVVPNNLIPVVTDKAIRFEFAPSAELKDDQKDPMKWYYHDWLIDNIMRDPNFLIGFMKHYLAGEIKDPTIRFYLDFYGLNDRKAFREDILWVMKNISRNVFKRIQAPTIVSLTDYGFGIFRSEAQGYYFHSEEFKALLSEFE